MSIKQRTHVDAVRESIEHVPTALDHYLALLDSAKDDLTMKGKSLQQANVEQISYLVYYDQIKIDMKAIHDHMEMLVDKVRGSRWRNFTEKSSIELSSRDKDMYIKQDNEYCIHYEIYLSVKEVYDKACSVVDCFINRGYALNNITRARCSDVHDSLL